MCIRDRNNTLIDIPPDRKVIVVYDDSLKKNKTKFVEYSDIDWDGSFERYEEYFGILQNLKSFVYQATTSQQV